jgi:transcriptional repressor NrdR
MKCPFCHSQALRVTDSRDALDINAIRRRRECLHCSRRFTTFETVEPTMQVHKRDGCYEEFQQKKLIDGISAACRHTTISHEQVNALASTITRDLMERQAKEISTTEIGEMVMAHLEKMDPIAYIRFACVYRRFKDVRELMDAIASTQTKDDTPISHRDGTDDGTDQDEKNLFENKSTLI